MKTPDEILKSKGITDCDVIKTVQDAMQEYADQFKYHDAAFVVVDAKNRIDGVAFDEQTAIQYVKNNNDAAENLDDLLRYRAVEIL